jgi:hypothetical protein
MRQETKRLPNPNPDALNDLVALLEGKQYKYKNACFYSMLLSHALSHENPWMGFHGIPWIYRMLFFHAFACDKIMRFIT